MIFSTKRCRMLCIAVALAMSASIVPPFASAYNSSNVRESSFSINQQEIELLTRACAPVNSVVRDRVPEVSDKCKQAMKEIYTARSPRARKPSKISSVGVEGIGTPLDGSIAAVALFFGITLYAAHVACFLNVVCAGSLFKKYYDDAHPEVKKAIPLAKAEEVFAILYRESTKLLSNEKMSLVQKYVAVEIFVKNNVRSAITSKIPVLKMQSGPRYPTKEQIDKLQAIDKQCAESLLNLINEMKMAENEKGFYEPVNKILKQQFSEIVDIATDVADQLMEFIKSFPNQRNVYSVKVLTDILAAVKKRPINHTNIASELKIIRTKNLEVRDRLKTSIPTQKISNGIYESHLELVNKFLAMLDKMITEIGINFTEEKMNNMRIKDMNRYDSLIKGEQNFIDTINYNIDKNNKNNLKELCRTIKDRESAFRYNYNEVRIKRNSVFTKIFKERVNFFNYIHGGNGKTGFLSVLKKMISDALKKR